MSQRIVHVATGSVIAADVRWARKPWARLRGLIGAAIPAGAALVLEPAAQIHTFGMLVPIDVVFCDADWTVSHIAARVRPRRVTRWVWGARRAIELPAGSLPADLRVGDRLELVVQ